MMRPPVLKPCAQPSKAVRPKPPPGAFTIDPKRIYQCQKAAQTALVAALGAFLDPATAAELRSANRQQAQELAILKKAIASKRLRRVISQTPDQ